MFLCNVDLKLTSTQIFFFMKRGFVPKVKVIWNLYIFKVMLIVAFIVKARHFSSYKQILGPK